MKLYSKEKSLNDEWEAGCAIKKEGGWVIIRGGCTHHDQREIVENDDENKSLYNPDNWAIGWYKLDSNPDNTETSVPTSEEDSVFMHAKVSAWRGLTSLEHTRWHKHRKVHPFFRF